MKEREKPWERENGRKILEQRKGRRIDIFKGLLEEKK